MNKVTLLGRLTKDPEIRTGANNTFIASFDIAVDRRFRKEGEPTADFIRCVAFGRIAEFIEKYFFKGSRILISGRIQTGSYTNREGQKVYTTDIVVEEAYFTESKKPQQTTAQAPGYNAPPVQQTAPRQAPPVQPQNPVYQQTAQAYAPQQPQTPPQYGYAAPQYQQPIPSDFVSVPPGSDDEAPFN